MDKQKVFDFVAPKLVEQGERSVNERGTCLYRGPGGRKCAIGHIIPDQLYSGSELEGKGIIGLLLTDSVDPSVNARGVAWAMAIEVLGGELTPDDVRFLGRLQVEHDRTAEAGPASWVRTMRYFAKANDLDASVLDKYGCAE